MSSCYPQLADRAWLRREYVERRRTGQDIAREVGCGISTLNNWLRSHDLVGARVPLKCSIGGCGRPHKGHGLCNMHYYRRYRHGDTDTVTRFANGTPESIRFWAKVDKTESCWLWIGATYPGGYGCTAMSEPTAHRWAWVEAHGPIPTGMVIHHKCAVRNCVNPAHLELATVNQNAAEMFARRALEARVETLEAENAELRLQLEGGQ